MNSTENNEAEYIGYDLDGYPFNKEFPPDERRFGAHHGGYPSDIAQVFFYGYLVQLYRVMFSIMEKATSSLSATTAH